MSKFAARLGVILLIAALIGSFGILRSVPNAEAASLSNTYLRLSQMDTGQAGAVRLVFRTASAGATSLTINMNGADTTTWTGQSGVVNTTQTVSSGSCAAETGATALPGSITAAGSGSTITISSITALSATTSYCVDLTSATAVTNPSSANEYHPVITAGSDSITVAVRIITNDSVTVNAVVPPSFNFVLSGNTDNFTANLASNAIGATTGITVTVNTNAKNGWIAWAKDTNTGLTSAAASKTISSTTPGTSATLSTGGEGYVSGVLGIVQGSGAGVTSAIAAYDASGSAHGSGLDTSLRQVATSTGTASNASFILRERATISTLTPAAGDYTDTITIVGAARF